MDPIAQQAAYAVALPLAIALAMVLAVRRKAMESRPKLATALGIAAVAVPMPVAFLLLNGAPDESWHRLVGMTAIGAVFAMATALGRGRFCLDAVWGVALAAAASAVVWPIYSDQEGPLERVLPVACMVAVVVSGEGLARREGGAVVGIGLWISCVCAGVGVLWMGQVPFGAAIAPIGASMLAIGIAAGLGRPVGQRGIATCGAASMVMSVALAWMWMSAIDANYGLWLPLVPTAAVGAAWVIRVRWVQRRARWVQCGVAWIAVLIVGVLGVGGMVALDERGSSSADEYDLPDFMRLPSE
jgi:hypothetical protein